MPRASVRLVQDLETWHTLANIDFSCHLRLANDEGALDLVCNVCVIFLSRWFALCNNNTGTIVDR